MALRILSLLFILCLWTCPSLSTAAEAKIAAVVNGEIITTFDLEKEMLPELMRLKIDPRNAQAAPQINQLRQIVLENMIRGITLIQEAQRLKIEVSEAEIDSELSNFLLQQKLTPAELQKQLSLQHSSEKEFRARIADSLLRNRLLATMVARKIVITKEEVKAYYDQHKDTFMSNQAVSFAMLVYPPNMSQEEVEKSIRRLQQNPNEFSAVVKKISVGPRAEEGGDLGQLPWEDVNQVLRDVLSALKVGQVSAPFNLNGLPCQVKLNALVSGSGQTLEQATPQIENILREPKGQARFDEYVEQLRRRAVVNIKI